MASSTGSAAVAETSRDMALAFAAYQERDAELRRKMEFFQAEVERQKMAKAEMETRADEEFDRVVMRVEFERDLAQEAYEDELRDNRALRAEVRALRAELRAVRGELVPARIL